MAQRQIILLEDDIQGGEAHETVQFNLDGVDYEIDLHDKNAKKLRDTLSPYVTHGRRVSSRRIVSSRIGDRSHGYDPKAVRAWAASNRVAVPTRGRIPAQVLDQYFAAGY